MKAIPRPVILLLPCLLAGCIASTRYEGGLKPVYPKPHAIQFYAAVRIDTLQPTFRWQAKDPSQKVDLAIWEAVYKGKGQRDHTGNYDRGSLVYEKEAIVGSEHTIDIKLAPDLIYFWSIKPAGTKNWATARHSFTDPYETQESSGLYFTLQTPRQ